MMVAVERRNARTRDEGVASTYHCDVVVLKLGNCGRRVEFKDYKLIVEGVKE